MAHQPIRRILHVRSRGPNRIIQIPFIHRPGIIRAKRRIITFIFRIQLLPTRPILRPCRPIPDHTQDTPSGIRRVERETFVRLHEARVSDAIVRRAHAYVPSGFLHDDAEDDADVDTRFSSDFLDGGFDLGDFCV